MTRGKKKKGLLLNLFHSFKPGNLIVGSHCGCPTEESDYLEQKPPYFYSRGKTYPVWAVVMVIVQLLSCVQLCYPIDCSTPDFPVPHLQSLLRLMSVELVTLSNHLILYVPPLLPSVFPSIIVVFSELALHIRWPKYWNFSFSISPFNEYSGLISFRIDWFDLLAIQGTLKSLFQHHNLKASVLGT